MRIFCAVRHSTDPKQYYGGLWSGNFYPALRQLGHQVVESKVDLLPTSRFMHVASDFIAKELEERAGTTEKILDEVRAAHRDARVDLFLSYFYNAHFDATGFEELRRLSIPSVNFYCNSIYQFEYVAEIAAKADYSWHPEKEARDRYLAVGARPIWVQMAADPDVYRALPEIRREGRACFVGQRYADRDRLMAALIIADVPVDIYGPGWGLPEKKTAETNLASTEYLGRLQHAPGTKASYLAALSEMMSRHGIVGGSIRAMRQLQYRAKTRRLAPLFLPFAKGSIPFQRIAEIFASHEICLNFSNVWADGRPGSRLIPHVRLRDFEAPMCRTCYLTGYSDEIAEFYELGKEIDTYKSPAELIEKTKFYLSNPEAAEHLRNACYERARRDHTWVHRFQELFGKIGLESNAAI
jgi:spore maturation protein CgeB